MKLTEDRVPNHLRVRVVYLFEGRTSASQLKKIGKTNTNYVTIARLTTSGGEVVATGRSACSRKDSPSRKIGRAIAVGRALQEYYA